jgi:biotin operon repressor
LNVKVGNTAIKPALALVAWAAFIKSGNTATTYGDLVLLDDEINPVISKLEERGIEIAALHNHLLHETPRIMYIHFVGRGDEVEMAKGIREALALTKTSFVAAAPSGPETKPELAKEIERIIGYEGSMGGGVFHIVVPRNDVHVAAMDTMIPGSMGMNTPLNFQLDGENAAINGDFMLLPAEVNPVIKILRANGIEVASLHNHMLYDEPRLFFMHFWANDNAEKLAKGLRAALDQMKAPRG